MYDSFIPALSEHHAGGVNVGRTVINGQRLGGLGMREQYLRGSDFARKLRRISIQRYRQLFRTYGPRSALYAEMVFGNMYNVRRLIWETPQTKIFAMRVPETLSLATIASTTGLSRAELKRFNPALVRRVPARAQLYLPEYVEEFGEDVSFWHRPASQEYAAVLNAVVRLESGLEKWNDEAFESVLRGFQERFADTGTEEGTVMATTLRFVIGDLTTSGRVNILKEFRTSTRILDLFERGKQELESRSDND